RGRPSMKPYQVAGLAPPIKTDESLKSHPEFSEDIVLMSHILVGGIYLASGSEFFKSNGTNTSLNNYQAA
ncbi:hypothetical protein, partial [Glutamicibacter arilaitensis]|uniref:hypothetical protein n=1 Tax=Glutamicibacter arilaitensis TaxID=256701 RepID=UPI003FD5BA63